MTDHINNLKNKLAHAEYVREVYEEHITSLLRYITGPKFHNDHNVNTADIFARIDELHAAVRDADAEPFGWAHPIKGIGVPGQWDYEHPEHKHGRMCSWECADGADVLKYYYRKEA